MIVGLLGDIHGNYLALQAVLNSARKEGVEKLLITGDLVGYYFWPDLVLELLEPWEKEVVRGNHEQMLTEARVSPGKLAQIEKRYGSGIRLTLENLTETQLDWLTSLPHPLAVSLGDAQLLLCHGSPWDLDDYIYPDSPNDRLDRCAAYGKQWIVLGHTHYPMLKRIGDVTVINPGSIGQPRNRMQGAHWAIVDTVSNKVEFRREAYDHRPVAAASLERHPELPYLAEVLSRA